MASLVGSIGLVLAGTELAVQALSSDQRGVVARVFKSNQSERVAKGALAAISLLSLAGIAFDTSASVRPPRRV